MVHWSPRRPSQRNRCQRSFLRTLSSNLSPTAGIAVRSQERITRLHQSSPPRSHTTSPRLAGHADTAPPGQQLQRVLLRVHHGTGGHAAHERDAAERSRLSRRHLPLAGAADSQQERSSRARRLTSSASRRRAAERQVVGGGVFDGDRGGCASDIRFTSSGSQLSPAREGHGAVATIRADVASSCIDDCSSPSQTWFKTDADGEETRALFEAYCRLLLTIMTLGENVLTYSVSNVLAGVTELFSVTFRRMAENDEHVGTYVNLLKSVSSRMTNRPLLYKHYCVNISSKTERGRLDHSCSTACFPRRRAT